MRKHENLGLGQPRCGRLHVLRRRRARALRLRGPWCSRSWRRACRRAGALLIGQGPAPTRRPPWSLQVRPALAGVGDLVQDLVALPAGVLAKRLQLLGKAVAVAGLPVGGDAGLGDGPLGAAAFVLVMALVLGSQGRRIDRKDLAYLVDHARVDLGDATL